VDVWAFLAARGFVYHRYWGSRARELEEMYLSDVVVARVRRTVPGGDSGRVEFGGLARLGGQKEMTFVVISIYALVFVVALVVTIRALV